MNEKNISIHIDGMKCGGCVSAVDAALKSVAGVKSVEVSLNDQCALVAGEASVADLISAVQSAGFTAATTA
ncbi:MAG: cation transporter [Gammaproteobacteria bacterium]|nr:cation transporter [Gammaproteobacteria bacterium]